MLTPEELEELSDYLVWLLAMTDKLLPKDEPRTRRLSYLASMMTGQASLLISENKFDGTDNQTLMISIIMSAMMVGVAFAVDAEIR
jgi:hypothetical protein